MVSMKLLHHGSFVFFFAKLSSSHNFRSDFLFILPSLSFVNFFPSFVVTNFPSKNDSAFSANKTNKRANDGE